MVEKPRAPTIGVNDMIAGAAELAERIDVSMKTFEKLATARTMAASRTAAIWSATALGGPGGVSRAGSTADLAAAGRAGQLAKA